MLFSLFWLFLYYLYHLRRRNCGMSQELLDVFHRNTGVSKHRGAGMSQIMEPDDSEVILLEELLEGSSDPVDLVSLPVLPNEDAVVVLMVVHLAEGLLPFLLLRLHIKEHILGNAH